MPLSIGAALQREKLTDATLYAKILAAVEKGECQQETCTVLRAKNGQRATSESNAEMVFPSEYDPPEILETKAAPAETAGGKETEKQTDSSSKTIIPAIPTNFDLRCVGFTMEIEPKLSEDGKTVDLRISPEHVTLQGIDSWGQGLSKMETPVFEVQRISHEITAKINVPYLLGTMNRPPNLKQQADVAKQLWFSFVTVTPAQ